MKFLDDTDVEFELKPRGPAAGTPRKPRDRSEEQQRWDDGIKGAFESNRQVFAVQIRPEEADDARKRVNSAVRLLDLAVTEGLPKPGKADGTVILMWLVRVPKKRGPRKPAEHTPAE